MNKINLTEHTDKNGFGLIYWKYNPKLLDEETNKTKCNMIKVECNSPVDYKKKLKQYQSKKQHFLYEMTGNATHSKLFFDCDRLHISKVDCKKYLLELYNLIDTLIDNPLDHSLYYVYVKYAVDNEEINSIHIIHKSKIHYDNGNLLTQKLKDSNLNAITESLDTGLYNKHRQFCLPYNSKPYSTKILDYGYDNPLQSKDIMFVDFNIKSKVFEITLPITEEDKILIEKQKSIFSNDFVDCDNRPNRLLLNKNCKELIVMKCIELLNTEFYTKRKCKEWIHLTRQLKNINSNEEHINMFLEHSSNSAEPSMKEFYTLQNNKNFYNTLTTEKCKLDSYKVISNIITKNNTDTYCYTEYLKYNVNEIIDYIHNRTGIDKPTIKESFNHKVMNDSEEECININKDTKYNITTGFLFHNDCITNYNVEIQHRTYDKINTEIDNETTIHTDKLNSDKVQKEVDLFINEETKYLSVASATSTR